MPTGGNDFVAALILEPITLSAERQKGRPMYKTVESMRTKDGIYIDRVIRPETQKEESMGMGWAKQRKWFFLYNCTLDENLAWATCEIKDDEGATYNFEKYEAYVEEVEPEPETPVEPEEPVEPENPEEETPTEEPVVEGE